MEVIDFGLGGQHISPRRSRVRAHVEAVVAFHICIAGLLPELRWRSVVKRSVQAFVTRVHRNRLPACDARQLPDLTNSCPRRSLPRW